MYNLHFNTIFICLNRFFIIFIMLSSFSNGIVRKRGNWTDCEQQQLESIAEIDSPQVNPTNPTPPLNHQKILNQTLKTVNLLQHHPIRMSPGKTWSLTLWNRRLSTRKC